MHPRVFVTKAGLEALRAARAHDAPRRMDARAGKPGGAEGRAAAAAGPAGAALAEQRRVRDRRGQPGLRGRAEAGVPRRGEARGRWRRSTTSRGATPTTSRTSISPPAICSMRSAGPTTCSTTTSPTPSARAIRASLERHAGLVYDYFAPAAGQARSASRRTTTSSRPPASPSTALALMGESEDAPNAGRRSRARIIIARDSC